MNCESHLAEYQKPPCNETAKSIETRESRWYRVLVARLSPNVGYLKRNNLITLRVNNP